MADRFGRNDLMGQGEVAIGRDVCAGSQISSEIEVPLYLQTKNKGGSVGSAPVYSGKVLVRAAVRISGDDEVPEQPTVLEVCPTCGGSVKGSVLDGWSQRDDWAARQGKQQSQEQMASKAAREAVERRRQQERDEERRRKQEDERRAAQVEGAQHAARFPTVFPRGASQMPDMDRMADPERAGSGVGSPSAPDASGTPVAPSPPAPLSRGAAGSTANFFASKRKGLAAQQSSGAIS